MLFPEKFFNQGWGKYCEFFVKLLDVFCLNLGMKLVFHGVTTWLGKCLYFGARFCRKEFPHYWYSLFPLGKACNICQGDQFLRIKHTSNNTFWYLVYALKIRHRNFWPDHIESCLVSRSTYLLPKSKISQENVSGKSC